MKTEIMNPTIMRQKGIKALTKALGPIGMIRFLQQFETGTGDYSKEREQWLGTTRVEDIVAEIKKKRKHG